MLDKIKKISKIVGLKKKHILFFVTINIISTLLSLVTPKLTAMFIDRAIPNKSIEILFYIVFGQIMALILTCFIQAINMYCSEKISLSLIRNGKISIVQTILKMPADFYSRYSTADLIHTVNSDIVKYVGFMKDTVLGFIMNSLTLIIVLLSIFLSNWVIGIISIVLIPLFAISFQINSKKLTKINKEVIDDNVKLSTSLHEKINNKIYIESCGKANDEAVKFSNELFALNNKSLKETRIRILPVLISMIISTVIVLMVYSVGSYFAIIDKLSPGTIVAISSWITMTGAPVNNIALIILNFKTTKRSIERSNEIFDAHSIPDVGLKLEAKIDNIRFENVSFSYESDEKYAADNISCLFEKGQITAIIGLNGSGKSTITKLILGLYEPKVGKIKINGDNMLDYSKDSIRKHIAYVPQNIVIWRKSVLDNITYLSDEFVDKDYIVKLLNLVGLDNVFPNYLSLEKIVGDDGFDLSGGERQKLALVRALYYKPDVLILDEATSNIDAASEKVIYKSIKKFLPDCIIISITHKLQLLDSVDKIILMDRGKMGVCGSFEELHKSEIFNTLNYCLEKRESGIRNF